MAATERWELGSMFTSTDDVEYSLRKHTRGVGIVLLNKIVPFGTRIIFDNRGQGFELLPYQLILTGQSFRELTIRVPFLTIAGSPTITVDLPFKLLLFIDETPINIVPLPIIDEFRFTAGATFRVSNIIFPNLKIFVRPVVAADELQYTYSIGPTRSSGGVYERKHFVLSNTLVTASKTINYPDPLGEINFVPTGAESTDYFFTVK